MIRPREIGYTDELLADRSVHRSYEDGRQEWRRRGPAGEVHWRDDQGGTGTDEPLGSRIVKRTHADGTVTYGRDIGYGRTLWGRGETVMINRTSFGGRMGAVLVGLGVAGLAVTASQLPPLSLTPEEEEELRQQAQSSSSGGGEVGYDGGGSDDDWDGGDWSDDGGGWSDDDFG
ncbi:hypothetical protein [Streptomyces shenzhenensis]|uniref:Uncharacterized protein n=1 Tax=Streptomyces shenzhenensis TaxID=943815 RepID=A0A3M0ICF4_9ACTN|nr:hypothetical protein [Streptomyces shenzhenensis]RMB83919.1 hypothetical protein CTZ28_20580 [Streptomyces shenzhenensis]